MATLDIFRNSSLLEHKPFRRNNSDNSVHEICLKSGLITSSFLIASFVGLCALTHRLEINQLSAVNLFLLALGVYFALEDFSPNGKGASIDYFEGFKVGLYALCIAVLIHTAFIFFYANLDASILYQISDSGLWSKTASPLMAAGITLFEGIAGGLIITYSLMQYFKKH